MSKPGGGNSETSERILSIEFLISSKESSDSSVLILFSINSGGGEGKSEPFGGGGGIGKSSDMPNTPRELN